MCRETVEITITQRIKVDRCIAEEIKWLNDQGVRTEGCCCGHGRTKANAMITPSSYKRAKELGYKPLYSRKTGLFKITLQRNIGG